MSYSVVITAHAERELEREMDYSTRQWGKKHAREYRRAIEKQVQQIADNPMLHPIKAAFDRPLRLVRFKGNYIVYWCDEDQRVVYVVGFPSVYRQQA